MDIITAYRYEISEAPCLPGSGRYGIRIAVPGDISEVFPYLNAVLEDTWYDRENQVLVGSDNGRRLAFRPDEIKVSGLNEATEAPELARAIVERVNQVWRERDKITPCYRERKVPPAIAIYQLLPKTNCKQCGYPTCLVFASELRHRPDLLDECPQLSDEVRQQVARLFAAD